MAVTKTDSFNSEHFSSAFECDERLETAGLTPHWQPEHLDRQLKRLAGEVLFLAEARYELTCQEAELVTDFIGAITNEAHHLFSSTSANARPAFRTHAAIRRNAGNCIAYAEAVNGLLRACELESYSLGIWAGRHATNGLVVGQSTFLLDGFSDEAQDYTQHLREDEVLYNAWLDTAHDNALTVVHKDFDNHRYTSQRVNSTDLHEIYIDSHYGYGTDVVLPGSTAILMYSAMAATNRHNLRYAQARDVLEPYAPASME